MGNLVLVGELPDCLFSAQGASVLEGIHRLDFVALGHPNCSILKFASFRETVHEVSALLNRPSKCCRFINLSSPRSPTLEL
jgi:hypothetical protein